MFMIKCPSSLMIYSYCRLTIIAIEGNSPWIRISLPIACISLIKNLLPLILRFSFIVKPRYIYPYLNVHCVSVIFFGIYFQELISDPFLPQISKVYVLFWAIIAFLDVGTLSLLLLLFH